MSFTARFTKTFYYGDPSDYSRAAIYWNPSGLNIGIQESGTGVGYTPGINIFSFFIGGNRDELRHLHCLWFQSDDWWHLTSGTTSSQAIGSNRTVGRCCRKW